MSEKTLPERMREAAETVREVNARYDGAEGHTNYPWTPARLESYADVWQTEDRAKAARVHSEGLLTNQIAAAFRGVPQHPMHIYRYVASFLLENGWQRVGTDE